MDTNKINREKKSYEKVHDDLAKSFFTFLCFYFLTLGMGVLLMDMYETRRHFEDSLSREFTRLSHRAVEKYGLALLPLLDVQTSKYSAANQLNICGIGSDSQQSNSIEFCSITRTAYINENLFDLMASQQTLLFNLSHSGKRHIGKSHEFYAQLAVSKSVVHQLNLFPDDKFKRRNTEYCLAGQSTSFDYGASPDIEESIVKEYLSLADTVVEDISPQQQIAAFKRGWSGEDCF